MERSVRETNVETSRKYRYQDTTYEHAKPPSILSTSSRLFGGWCIRMHKTRASASGPSHFRLRRATSRLRTTVHFMVALFYGSSRQPCGQTRGASPASDLELYCPDLSSPDRATLAFSSTQVSTFLRTGQRQTILCRSRSRSQTVRLRNGPLGTLVPMAICQSCGDGAWRCPT